MNKKNKAKKSKTFSLLRPTGMGGIYGGDGYRFQDGYIVCHIPKWLADQNFLRFMPEGTGDVDIVYKDHVHQVYEHVQVKDNEVSCTEFKKIIKTFIEIDNGTKNVYRKFTLACPSVGKKVKTLLHKIKRYKEAKPLYDKSNVRALQTSESDLKNEFQKIGINEYYDFVERKVDFEVGQSNFSDTTVCKQLFVSALAEHPLYKKKLHDVLKPIYPVLLETVLSNRGKAVDGRKIHLLINSVLSGSKGLAKSTILHVHNWTVEKFDNKATIALDWSKYFDRQNRKVPDADIWNTKLIPELFKARKEIAKTTQGRHIVFRGKSTLSTGIALGIAFPEVGNWSFEIPQPPQTVAWRSDADKIQNYKLKYQVVNPASVGVKSGGKDLVCIFNITGKALNEVVNYLKMNKILVKKIIMVQPNKTPGNLSIQDDSEAVSIASATKDILKTNIIKYTSKKTHLFFYGPFGLALFLGQKLTSVGEVQLYEFQDPGYKPSALLKT